MQLRFRVFLAVIAIYITHLSLRPLPAYSNQVQFITEEVPPIAYTHNGILTGYNIDLVRYIWKQMHIPEHKVKVQPWARSIKYFNTKTPTCLFPVVLTKQRRATYRSVATPFSFKIVLFTLKKNANQFTSSFQLKNARICVTKTSSILHLLREGGYSDDNFEYGTSFANTVIKFHKERAPLLVGSIPSVVHNYRQIGGNTSDLHIVSVIKTVPNGFLFNDAVPQSFIDNFQKAMDQFTYTDETKTIYDKARYYYNPTQ
ncbi:substrate-binding periplasmic protein [Halodesulfovibrio marinisediminis]|uniref:ABC-type amino acid transport substrate-binding protein n=1 Tax=Halodesulfovibrio marinisediminis DSM 17456 TaxID=1121457 RepID=A0A1N6DJL0_9BACT|nr:ABC transporter substrate-binding protein [Halodesulfovibrio marinisediminis]SIN70916.1 ABC-type amino acid transport substrate-binding protein [Halodesulfovibrio marinisediminis DSM 17456]